MSARMAPPMQAVKGLTADDPIEIPGPRPRPLASVSPAAPVVEPAPETESAEVSTPKRARRPRASSPVDTKRAVSVSVPLSLAEAWRDRARQQRISQVDLLLDAIVAHQDDLATLLAAATAKPEPATDGLFARKVKAAGERHVGVSLRIEAANWAVIDKLAKEHGPVPKARLIAAVLAAYLA